MKFMWNKIYKKRKFYWGLKPDPLLMKYLPRIPKGKALDIGAGEGRNSIFLAKEGFEVEAIDIVKEGLKKCEKLTKKYKLSITTRIIDVKKFKFKPRTYSLIISVAGIDFLKYSEIKKIINKIKSSLKKDGIVYIVSFTTKDPAYKILKHQKEIEKNTFYSKKLKQYRHFFEPGELKSLFKNFRILYYREYFKEDAHPKPHQHALAVILAQKVPY
jgi:tellurite methyltransferase